MADTDRWAEGEALRGQLVAWPGDFHTRPRLDFAGEGVPVVLAVRSEAILSHLRVEATVGCP